MERVQRVLRLSMATATMTVAFASWASAAVIAEYAGPTVPTDVAVTSTSSTNWAIFGTGTTAYGSAVAADSSASTPAAWRVNDTGNKALAYIYQPTADEHAQAAANGWTLSSDLRVNNVDDALDASIWLQYAYPGVGASHTGRGMYYLQLGSDADGNALVSINGGSSATVTGAGFHLYELKFDSTAGAADLFVDGSATALIFDVAPAANGTNLDRIMWGSNGGSGLTGSADYATVQFEIEAVPEPASLSIVVLGGLGVLARKRKVA